MKILTKKQTDYINEHFFEFGFEDEEVEPTYEQFKKIETPARLHYLASIYNWDDGGKVLEWIVNSKKCAKATALLLFWRSEPDYYTRFETEEEAADDLEIWKVVRTILKNYQTGFYQHRGIGFNPSDDGADVNYVDTNAKWKIPESIKRSVSGGQVIALADIYEAIGYWWKNRQKRRRRRKKRSA